MYGVCVLRICGVCVVCGLCMVCVVCGVYMVCVVCIESGVGASMWCGVGLLCV